MSTPGKPAWTSPWPLNPRMWHTETSIGCTLAELHDGRRLGRISQELWAREVETINARYRIENGL